MDDVTTTVALVTHDDQQQAEQWFERMCGLWDEVRDGDAWMEFRDKWPDVARDAGFTSEAAEQFIQGVEDLPGDPVSLLNQVADRRDELPYLHASIVEQAAAEAQQAPYDQSGYAESAYAESGYEQSGYPQAADSGGSFGWLNEDPSLVERVGTAFGYQPEHYESHLGPYLEQAWGTDWEQHPADHKRAWLDQLLSQVAPATGETGAGSSAEPAESTEYAEPPGSAPGEAAGEVSPDELGDEIAKALANAMAEVPEAADLSDEDIREVLAMVIEQQSAAAQ